MLDWFTYICNFINLAVHLCSALLVRQEQARSECLDEKIVIASLQQWVSRLTIESENQALELRHIKDRDVLILTTAFVCTSGVALVSLGCIAGCAIHRSFAEYRGTEVNIRQQIATAVPPQVLTSPDSPPPTSRALRRAVPPCP